MTNHHEISAVGQLILVRLLTGADKGATLSQVKKDVEPLLQHRWTGASLTDLLDANFAQLGSAGLLNRTRKGKTDRGTLTEAGRRHALEFLGIDDLPALSTWTTLKKTYLLARVLGLPAPRGEGVKRFSLDTGFKAALLKSTHPKAMMPTIEAIYHGDVPPAMRATIEKLDAKNKHLNEVAKAEAEHLAEVAARTNSPIGALPLDESDRRADALAWKSIGVNSTRPFTKDAVNDMLDALIGKHRRRDLEKNIAIQKANLPASKTDDPAPNAPATKANGECAVGSADPVVSEPVGKSLAPLMQELDVLIGLPGVKAEVRRLMGFLTIQRERRRQGLRESGQTLHFVFTGNPGTGKTTVARIIGKMLHAFGLLKTAKVVECSRTDLVGGFLGQTALKTEKMIDSALDGVLFIDEAYALTDTRSADCYGSEAVNTLLKRMEDDRDRLVVVVAGYPAPMKEFLQSNPGLSSRFTRIIVFEDYDVPDLCRIFEKFCREAEYTLSPAAYAQASLLFTLAYEGRDERFGNGRFVRNVFELATARHSQRLTEDGGGSYDRQSLMTIDGSDIPLETFSHDEPSRD
jgi:hypothetical protein